MGLVRKPHLARRRARTGEDGKLRALMIQHAAQQVQRYRPSTNHDLANPNGKRSRVGLRDVERARRDLQLGEDELVAFGPCRIGRFANDDLDRLGLVGLAIRHDGEGAKRIDSRFEGRRSQMEDVLRSLRPAPIDNGRATASRRRRVGELDLQTLGKDGRGCFRRTQGSKRRVMPYGWW